MLAFEARAAPRHRPGMAKSTASVSMGNRIRQIREASKLTLEELAALLGAAHSTVSRLERGERKLTQHWLERLARVLNVQPSDLLNSDARIVPTTTVMVRGAVQAGAWVEAEQWPEEDWYAARVPVIDPEFKNVFGLLVRGNSMNQVYRENTVVICVPLNDYAQRLEAEDHVIVRRVNRSGLVEFTVKELRFDGEGRAWLWPRSTEPEHQAPLAWPAYDRPSKVRDIEEVSVVAVVVGGYWQRRPRG